MQVRPDRSATQLLVVGVVHKAQTGLGQDADEYDDSNYRMEVYIWISQLSKFSPSLC